MRWLFGDGSAEFLSLLQDMTIEPGPETFDQALEKTLHLARQHGLSTYDAS